VVYESYSVPLIRIFYNNVEILEGVWLWRISGASDWVSRHETNYFLFWCV